MQAAIVLAAESRSAIYHLPLATRPDLRGHLGPDRAAVAARPYELQLDPVRGIGGGAIKQPPSLLLRNPHLRQAPVRANPPRHTPAVPARRQPPPPAGTPQTPPA